MRPYLAIIKDAFREALASRVLWIALGMVVLVLICLAPLSYQPVMTTSFNREDIFSRQQFLMLVSGEKRGNSGTPRVAQGLKANQREKAIAASKGNDQPPSDREIAEWLNELLDRPHEWFDPEIWKDLTRLREQRELESKSERELSTVEQRRLVRLRLEAALPGVLKARSNQSVRVTYGPWEFPYDLPVSPEEFKRLLNGIVLPFVINLLLGIAAVFVAILVTSPLVPQLFNSGSLPLLLSKPIHRAPLLLSIFVGATAFILVLVIPLVVGLMLIGWLQFDLWNPRLLLCIPLFVLTFLVYYSVSATAALVWRNAIVSVAVTIVFWLFCFLIQMADEIAEGLLERPHTLQRIEFVGKRLLAATEAGRLTMWDPQKRQWQTLIDSTFFERRWLLGPVPVADGGAVLARGRWPIGGPGRLMLLRRGGMDPEPTWQLPKGCMNLFADNKGGVIAATTDGPYRIDPEKVSRIPNQEPVNDLLQPALSWLGIRKNEEAFTPLLPLDESLQMPISQVVTGDGALIVASRGELLRLSWQSRLSKVEVRRTIPGTAERSVILGWAAGTLVCYRSQEPLQWLNAQTFEPLKSMDVKEEWGDIMEISAHPEGKFLVAWTNRGNLLKLDTQQRSIIPLRSYSKIHAIAWQSPDDLLVAHDVDSVDQLEIASGSRRTSFRPRVDGWRTTYRLAIRPLAKIAPQPSRLGETVSAIILGDNRVTLGDRNLSPETIDLRPWQALINCLAFTALMSFICCVFFERLDL